MGGSRVCCSAEDRLTRSGWKGAVGRALAGFASSGQIAPMFGRGIIAKALTALFFSASVADAEITVFAAASLSDALSDAAAAWEAGGGDAITLSFAGSSTLARQIEAGRRAMTRRVKRGGKIWIRVFPDKPITKKPLEVRQGKGKGNVEYWVCQIQPGRVLYEMEGVTEEVAREAFRLASAKLPLQTNFARRQVG